MAHGLKAEAGTCLNPVVFHKILSFELVQMKSDALPVFVQLIREVRDIRAAHPLYATHDFEIKALVSERYCAFSRAGQVRP